MGNCLRWQHWWSFHLRETNIVVIHGWNEIVHRAKSQTVTGNNPEWWHYCAHLLALLPTYSCSLQCSPGNLPTLSSWTWGHHLNVSTSTLSTSKVITMLCLRQWHKYFQHKEKMQCVSCEWGWLVMRRWMAGYTKRIVQSVIAVYLLRPPA